jgi:transcriptional regulator with XRE-family HTH domain
MAHEVRTSLSSMTACTSASMNRGVAFLRRCTIAETWPLLKPEMLAMRVAMPCVRNTMRAVVSSNLFESRCVIGSIMRARETKFAGRFYCPIVYIQLGIVKLIMATKADTIAGAVAALQQALGETQEGMARRLGCTLGAYSKWVRGERTPSGRWLLKLIALCPDPETRARFGLDIEAHAHKARGALRNPPRSEAEEELLRHYNDAATGLSLLYEAAAAGHSGAAEQLRALAEKINKTAGDWRQMKYRKK